MLGVPFVIRGDGQDPTEEETVYLSTRRRGDAGAKMKQLRRQYHKLEFESAKALRAVALVMTKAERLKEEDPQFDEKLARLAAEQDSASGKAEQLQVDLMEVAEELVGAALRENYQKKTDGILDRMTDAELRAAIVVMETGEGPVDFFRSNATPQKSPTTSPPGDSPGKPSSEQGSRRQKSKRGK